MAEDGHEDDVQQQAHLAVGVEQQGVSLLLGQHGMQGPAVLFPQAVALERGGSIGHQVENRKARDREERNWVGAQGAEHQSQQGVVEVGGEGGALRPVHQRL